MIVRVAAQIDVEIDDNMLAEFWLDSDIDSEAEQRADAERCAEGSLEEALGQANPPGIKFRLLNTGSRILNADPDIEEAKQIWS